MATSSQAATTVVRYSVDGGLCEFNAFCFRIFIIIEVWFKDFCVRGPWRNGRRCRKLGLWLGGGTAL